MRRSSVMIRSLRRALPAVMLLACGAAQPSNSVPAPNSTGSGSSGSTGGLGGSSGGSGNPCSDGDGDLRGEYCLSGSDCAPEDRNHWDDCGRCVDVDQDGFGVECDRGDDCDDGNHRVYGLCDSCKDSDGDGHWVGCDVLSVNTDCDDGDASKHTDVAGFTDSDGDGYTVEDAAEPVCSNGTLPSGFVATSAGVDCDDNAAQYTVTCPGKILGDLNPGSISGQNASDPTQLVSVLSSGRLTTSVLFFGYDQAHGKELFRLNSISGPANLVRDIVPGNQAPLVKDVADFGSRALFVLDDRTHGDEIYVSDGTPAGTKLVRDLHNGNVPLTLYGGTYGYFVLNNNELWATDGTYDNTTRVPTTYTVPSGNSLKGTAMTGGGIYFASSSASQGNSSLWRSYQRGALSRVVFTGMDLQTVYAEKLLKASASYLLILAKIQNGYSLWQAGTGSAGGTANRLVNNSILPPLDGDEPRLEGIRFGNVTYFTHCPIETGCELYKASGTQAVVVSDINPGGASSRPYGYIACGDYFYFGATSSAAGRELWKSNGSTTTLVKNIASGDNSGYPEDPIAVCSYGKLFFVANDGTGRELYVTEGSSASTTVVRTLNISNTLNKNNLIAWNGGVLFTFTDPDEGRELWYSNGTSVGTKIVHKMMVANTSEISSFHRHNGQAVFAASDFTHGRELWKSDGTSANTQLVKDINAGVAGSSPSQLTSVGSVLYFSATDSSGTELWSSGNLSAANTLMVKDINAMGGSNPTGLAAINDKLFFSASDGASGQEPWVSNNTSAGTTRIADINSGANDSQPTKFTALGTSVHFAAAGTNGTELFNTSYATPTTVTEIQVNPSGNGAVDALVEVNSLLYFVGTSVANGRELFRLNDAGTAAQLVQEIAPAAANSDPHDLTPFGDQLLFAAQNGSVHAVYITDAAGSSATSLGTFVAPGPKGFVVVGSTAYFLAEAAGQGVELWKTDGTTATLVKNINPGATLGAGISKLYPADSKLFFFADDGTSGKEPWVSDGSNAGTVKLKDINPGRQPSSGDFSGPFVRFKNGHVLFPAANDLNGIELWVSDGTPAGTRLQQDIFPGPGSASPRQLTLLPNDTTPTHLLFIANTKSAGDEPWALELSGL